VGEGRRLAEYVFVEPVGRDEKESSESLESSEIRGAFQGWGGTSSRLVPYALERQRHGRT